MPLSIRVIRCRAAHSSRPGCASRRVAGRCADHTPWQHRPAPGAGRRPRPAGHRMTNKNPGLQRPGRHNQRAVYDVETSGSADHVLPPWLEKGRTTTSRQASWLPVIATRRTGYSCGTALDLHQLPPLRPGIRASGSPQRYSIILGAMDTAIIAYFLQPVAHPLPTQDHGPARTGSMRPARSSR